MNKPAVALGTTTLLFAACTAYLGWRLMVDRERSMLSAPPATTSLATAPAPPAEGSAAPGLRSPNSAFVRQENPPAMFQPPPILDAKGYLKFLENPQSRADELRAMKGSRTEAAVANRR